MIERGRVTKGDKKLGGLGLTAKGKKQLKTNGPETWTRPPKPPSKCLAGRGLAFAKNLTLARGQILMPDNYDPIERPRHYCHRGGIEPFAFIQSNHLGFAAGNVFKYFIRYEEKGGSWIWKRHVGIWIDCLMKNYPADAWTWQMSSDGLPRQPACYAGYRKAVAMSIRF